MQDFIRVRGAREHNLKNVDIDIPKNQLVVFTGVSGSGKSSMAFDTIYAEGQRRYVESLSSYARQFLGVMDKPDVEHIEGLSPAISIDQKSASHNPRSTVGTVTEIYDYLRLLFARIGHPHCPICGREIQSQSVEHITNSILQKAQESLKSIKSYRFLILSPVIRGRKGEYSDLFSSLRQKGYSQVRIDGKIIGLNEDLILLKNNKHDIDVVIDKIVIDKPTLNESRSRLFSSIEQSVKLSDGLCILAEVKDKTYDMPTKPQMLNEHLYSQKLSCPYDNLSLPELEPRMFSFNAPQGACSTCSGLGNLLKIDEKLILNPNLTISEGGVLPYANTFSYDSWFAQKVAHYVNIKIPISKLTKEDLKILLWGTKPSTYQPDKEALNDTNQDANDRKDWFEGIIPNLERRYKQTDSDFIRNEIEKYMRKEICPDCLGQRLKRESLSVTVAGQNIIGLTQLSISNTLKFIGDLLPSNSSNPVALNDREIAISTPILKEISARLGFLVSVGLDYLTLNRSATTLAGGEAQRIRLASQIGSGLSGVLYVLDEPSIGLHQRDNRKLIETLKRLRDLGNSVVVVEHDREMMEESDYIFDFGPGAGDHGGKVIAHGNPNQIKNDSHSITGRYLSNSKTIKLEKTSQKHNLDNFLTISGVNSHNLKNLTVNIPLGKLVIIAGVSGSGKSTLLVDTLYHALAGKFNSDHKEKPGNYDLLGISHSPKLITDEQIEKYINRVILVDQSPIGRTPRSNPATYTGLFGPIRDLFALSPEAKIRGYAPGRFSFNVKGGRCENCQGEGQIKIEMQFLPDIFVKCDLCHGTRYNSETLEVHFKGKNISEILDFTVDEAIEFFQNIPIVKEKLQTLQEVGLNYIRLGQPAPTLSGGEAQRVKLATELSKKSAGKSFYILDEPTTGLHFADLEKLLSVLQKLTATGNTVVVIEHNTDVIENADWIIELGPEGGDQGGYLIAEGTPAQLSHNSTSITGQYLSK